MDRTCSSVAHRQPCVEYFEASKASKASKASEVSEVSYETHDFKNGRAVKIIRLVSEKLSD